MSISKNPLRLKEFLELSGLRQSYDVIIIDCPPSSLVTKLALLSSDGYIIPSLVEPMSTFGIANLITDIHNLEKQYDLRIELIGILLTMVSPHYHVYQETKALIKQIKINDVPVARYLFKEELRKRTKISHALSHENKQKGKQFLVEIGDLLIFDEMKKIAEEFTRKVGIT